HERQPDVALTLVGCVIHSDQQSLFTCALPAKRQETIRRPVALPGRNAFEQPPVALAQNRTTEHGKQSFIKLLNVLIDRFVRCSNQMRRDPFLSSFELSLVKEPQAWRQERDDGRGLMHFW